MEAIKKTIDFIFASRPMLLFPTWSIYLVTYEFINRGRRAEYEVIGVLAGVTLITVGAYFINQIYDYESDLQNKKLGFLQKGLISRTEMVAACLSGWIVALIMGFVLDYRFGIIFILMILLGFAYSVPPARLKDRPVGGLMANALGYGILVPVSVPGFLYHFDAAYLYLFAYFFVTVAAEYLLTIIPDREGDRRTGKTTLAAFQTNRPIIFAGIIFLVVSLYSAAIIAHNYLTYISIISIILYVAAFIFNRNGIILFACRFPILLLTILAGISFPTYLVFIIALLILSRIYYQWRFGIIYPKLW